MVATVYVVLSCDVDHDRERIIEGIAPDTMSWRGALEGIPALKTSLRGLRDAAGREPVFTWFLRVDDQVRLHHGTFSWFVTSQTALLTALTDSGDELAWHPHFWRRDCVGGPWYQEIENTAWNLQMLRDCHAELASGPLGAPACVRMGWSYHTNDTMAELDRLGVAVDLSALPGFRTFDARKVRSENLYDWFETPRAPYYPSVADYRRPARNGEPAFRLLEVPSFMASSPAWSLVAGAQLARKTRAPRRLLDAVRRPTYCINVTAQPRYFAPLLSALRHAIRRGSGPLVFETHFHADEVIANTSGLYTLAAVRENIAGLLRTCEAAGARVEFVQARHLPALLAA